jgi:hypothetical protein
MSYLPYVVAISTFCFVWSYGIQKRRRWAWYMGWVFAAVVAAAIIGMAIGFVLYTATRQELLGRSLAPVGASCVWIFWARWWAAQRGEFGSHQADAIERDR